MEEGVGSGFVVYHKNKIETVDFGQVNILFRSADWLREVFSRSWLAEQETRLNITCTFSLFPQTNQVNSYKVFSKIKQSFEVYRWLENRINDGTLIINANKRRRDVSTLDTVTQSRPTHIFRVLFSISSQLL